MGVNLDQLNDTKDPPMRTRPAWRRTPTRATLAARKDPEKLFDNIDEYFAKCYDEDSPPTLCDMAGHAGFDSVTQMVNHARRNGGQLMRGISRGVLTVAANYEESAMAGNRSALQLLSLMPHFDSHEPADQKPERPFLPQTELNLNISGVERKETQGAQLSGQEAYLKLIKHKTYEELSAGVLETKRTVEGDFEVLELGED